MPKKQETIRKVFYKSNLAVVKVGDPFFLEYSFILKTIGSVNSFNSLYKIGKKSAGKGPSTHELQDLYRAMLIFACAGLDVLIKQLMRTKLPKLVVADKKSKDKFKEYVRKGLQKNEKEILNTVAFALIDQNPRDVFLTEYIESMTSGSLQSVDEICKFSEASGLDTKSILDTQRLNILKDAFGVRNQIIHEMDINTTEISLKTTGYRTRRQRKAANMEKHTKSILDLSEDIFKSYKDKFTTLNIDVDKVAV